MIAEKLGKAFRMIQSDVVRWIISRAYIKGRGLEIGGLHHPLPLSGKASVRYVDRLSVDELRKQYPELNGKPLVPVDIIDNGETLSSQADKTQDFVIANHFLEHTENPILAVINMLRVLKPGGILYAAIPDKRFTFDRDRPITSLDHLIKDYKNGPSWSNRAHYEEFQRSMSNIEDEAEFAIRTDALMKMNYSIHFHVWTQKQMFELFAYVSDIVAGDFEYQLVIKNLDEVIFVIRRK